MPSDSPKNINSEGHRRTPVCSQSRNLRKETLNLLHFAALTLAALEPLEIFPKPFRLHPMGVTPYRNLKSSPRSPHVPRLGCPAPARTLGPPMDLLLTHAHTRTHRVQSGRLEPHVFPPFGVPGPPEPCIRPWSCSSHTHTRTHTHTHSGRL